MTVTLALIAPATAANAPLADRIKEARERTQRCQSELGVKRSPVSSSPIRSRAYARWVLTLWKARAQAYCGALRQVRQLFSFDEARAAKQWASTSGARCVSSHEGAVTSNTGNGYYGKWQADISFQLAYGREFYERWGVASNWPAWAQNVMAYRGYQSRGWQPWPTTSVICGLR